MHGIRKTFVYLLCIGMIFGFADNVFSFSYSGYKYDSLPVDFYFNSAGTSDVSGDAEFDALTASFNTWQAVSSCSWTWSYQGRTGNSSYGSFDGQNLVGWAYLGGSTIGQCTWWTSGSTILESDIVLSSGYTWSTTGAVGTMDVQNVATHEIGHTLSLGHSSDPEATMWAYGEYGETKRRTLEQDDIDGINYIYPYLAQKASHVSLYLV